MKNTKKIRLVIEGFVPEDFPIKNLTTSGRHGSVAEWCPLYVHAGVGGEYGADYTSVLEGHMTMSAEVVVPPEPEYKNGQIWQSASGDVYRRSVLFGETGWIAFGSEELYPDSFPSRPLTLIHDV